MQKSYFTRIPTTDGFIRTQLRVNRKPLSVKVVWRQHRHLTADTVTECRTSNENQARLVFYSKLAQQSPPTPHKSYSLTEEPVGRNLSIELFADEIETRLQNALHKNRLDTRGKRGLFGHSKRHRRMQSQLNRTKNLLLKDI